MEVDFASEWENFEKLIGESSGADKSTSSSTSAAPAQFKALSPKRKRIFREESDKSDTDDERIVSPIRQKTDSPEIQQQSGSSSPSSSSVSGDEQLATSSHSDDETSDEDSSAEIVQIEKDKSNRIEQLAADRCTGKERRPTDIRKSTDTDDSARRVIPDRSSGSRSSKLDDAVSQSGTKTDDRIQAKLMAIADSADTAQCRGRSPRDRRPSKRSPSPRSGNKSRSRIHGRDRRRSRSRSRERRHHSRSRSRGRRHRNRSRSGDRHYRRSHRRHSRTRHSPSRSQRRRSKSRSPDRASKNQPLNFKEQMKANLLSAAQKQAAAAAAAAAATEAVLGSSSEMQSQPNSVAQSIANMMKNQALLKANEKPSNLPLNVAGGLGTLAAGSIKVTPQQALAQTMAAMNQKVQEMTGVALPSYYNPAAVNPLKYAEQLKKRKLLWSKAPKESTAEAEPDTKAVQSVAQWTGSSFVADSDGKMAAKFTRLMGIKEEDKKLLGDNVDMSKLSEEQRRKQEELFQQLDKEYAFARMTTHTHRGIGLGFQSQGLPDPQ